MYDIIEPRIEAIKKEIERILSLVQFERNGRPIKIDGFRLRNLSNWKTGLAQNVFDVLGPLSGICNAKCVFCMEKSLPFARDNSFLSLKEATTRLKYYTPDKKRCLFPSARPHMETFLNKDTVEILKRARGVTPKELFVITTNGSTLTPDVVKRLSEVKPLLIKLSVNSTDTKTRKSFMGINANTYNCMELLGKEGIPFIGSIVAWPGIGNEDIETSIRDISTYDPYGIRIRLPLVHKYTPVKPEADLKSFWQNVWSFVNFVKEDIDVPIWVEPIQYGRVPVVPIIDGVIKNSPAMKAGLLPGDLMISIDGESISSRLNIRELFSAGDLDSRDSVEVEVKRMDKLITFKLGSTAVADPAYPYDKGLRHPGERLGILFLPDFDIGYLDNILKLTMRHNAKRVLLFSSPLTAGTVERLIEEVSQYREFFSERDLWIYTLEDTWMEGNTSMLDSRFVEDYKKAILKVCLGLKDRPDLILIPDCFGSSWGIDFNGHSVFEIESRTGVSVELLPWHYIYGRED